MMQRSGNFPLYKTKVIEPVGLGEGSNNVSPSPGARRLTRTCTQSQINHFAPTKQRGFKSLRLAEHKELNLCVENNMKAKMTSEQMTWKSYENGSEQYRKIGPGSTVH